MILLMCPTAYEYYDIPSTIPNSYRCQGPPLKPDDEALDERRLTYILMLCLLDAYIFIQRRELWRFF